MKYDWKQVLDLKNEQVIGLDIGSAFVKMVQLKRTPGGFAVSSASIAEIGNSAMDDDRTRISKVSSAVEACLRSGKTESKQVVAGLCGPEVAVRSFAFPELPAEEMTQAVLLEADQVCPFDISSNVLDYQLLGGPQNGQVKGILVAAAASVIRAKTQVISNSGLNCALVDVDGLALANCLIETGKFKHGSTMMILNVGSNFTNLVIVNDGLAPFIRDITRGGKHIIEQFALTLNMTRSNAQKLLLSNGSVSRDDFMPALSDASSSLVNEINETLRYYSMEQRVGPVSQVCVCGGYSLVAPFIEILAAKLPAQVAVWNPLEYMACQGDVNHLLVKNNGPVFAVAAGLAMRLI
jgi:type IV pilus assembly protein PilM